MGRTMGKIGRRALQAEGQKIVFCKVFLGGKTERHKGLG